MNKNPILNSSNESLAVTNFLGAGVLNPVTTLEGLPLGTGNDGATGELGVKVRIVGANISIGSVDAEARATAAAPTYTEGSDNILSQDLSGHLRVTFKSGSAVALNAGSAIVGQFGIDQTTPGTTNRVSIGTDGTVALNAAIPAGSNTIGKVGIDQTTDGTTNKVNIGNTGSVTLLAGSAIAGKFGIDQSTPGTTNAVQLSGSQLTISSSTVTGSGASPVAAGKKHVEFIFSNDFTGTINGQAYAGTADAAQIFDAPAGYTFDSIPYTVTAGSMRIHSY